MESLIIKCSISSDELQLSGKEGLSQPVGYEYYCVTLKMRDMSASAEVYAYEPADKLVDFFKDLATSWRGWKGEKSWRSLEGEFSLNCTSDRRGHVTMEVELESPGDGWEVRGNIFIDAGQLDEIAAKIKDFF